MYERGLLLPLRERGERRIQSHRSAHGVQVVDWQLVRKLVDCSRGLKELLAPAGEETIFAADDDVTAPLDADTRALFTGAISSAHTGGCAVHSCICECAQDPGCK